MKKILNVYSEVDIGYFSNVKDVPDDIVLRHGWVAALDGESVGLSTTLADEAPKEGTVKQWLRTFFPLRLSSRCGFVITFEPGYTLAHDHGLNGSIFYEPSEFSSYF